MRRGVWCHHQSWGEAGAATDPVWWPMVYWWQYPPLPSDNFLGISLRRSRLGVLAIAIAGTGLLLLPNAALCITTTSSGPCVTWSGGRGPEIGWSKKNERRKSRWGIRIGSFSLNITGRGNYIINASLGKTIYEQQIRIVSLSWDSQL